MKSKAFDRDTFEPIGWNEFCKQYRKNIMNDNVNTVETNKEELAKILGIPVENITDVKVTEGKDADTIEVDKAQAPAETPAQ